MWRVEAGRIRETQWAEVGNGAGSSDPSARKGPVPEGESSSWRRGQFPASLIECRCQWAQDHVSLAVCSREGIPRMQMTKRLGQGPQRGS